MCVKESTVTDICSEEVVSSTSIYQGRVLHLRNMTVKLSSGDLYTRELVEHPGAVALIPILKDEKIVLIRQFRLTTGEVIYELPAGTMSKGEDPDTCAAREITEETGYKASKLRKMFQCYLAPGYSTELMYFYLATELEAGHQHLDADESIRVCPMPMDDALEMIRRNEIVDAKTIVGLLLYDKFERRSPAI